MRWNRQTLQKVFFMKNINRVVRFMTMSDILLVGSFGLIAPIFAVFVTDNIADGTVEVAGVATAIYLLTRSIGQIPISVAIDKLRGEHDDFWALFLGSIIVSTTPLLYLTISTAAELYLVQLVYGIGSAATFPTWMAIFTRHIDSDHEGTEWGIYQMLVDLGGAAAGAVGGVLALRFGFATLFIIVSILSFVGSFTLIGIRPELRRKAAAKEAA